MRHDHRRVLATALSRLRAKIKYRPVIFELMPPEFTLLQLQNSVEAISGRLLHKQNFRRQIQQQKPHRAVGYRRIGQQRPPRAALPLPRRRPARQADFGHRTAAGQPLARFQTTSNEVLPHRRNINLFQQRKPYVV